MKLGPVDHITLNTTDIEAATEYYKKLGMEVEGTLDDGDIVFLTNGDPDHPMQIQLDTVHEGMEPGLNHIAFFMDDVEGAADEVREQGIDSRHDPFLQPRSGRTIFTFRGPDGVALQFARKDQRGEYEDFG